MLDVLFSCCKLCSFWSVLAEAKALLFFNGKIYINTFRLIISIINVCHRCISNAEIRTNSDKDSICFNGKFRFFLQISCKLLVK